MQHNPTKCITSHPSADPHAPQPSPEAGTSANFPSQSPTPSEDGAPTPNRERYSTATANHGAIGTCILALAVIPLLVIGHLITFTQTFRAVALLDVDEDVLSAIIWKPAFYSMP